MPLMINTPLTIGTLQIPHRLVQGPLAGYSCAPFRQMFSAFHPPAYCVSEMISAHDVVHKHDDHGRYLFRSAEEGLLCYQIAGHDADTMAAAASRLAALGADLIDINCGCPKNKIRKKGAGSALLEKPDNLVRIVERIRQAISCPLTVKLRIQGEPQDSLLTRRLADAGADALIIHGRRWNDDYDTPCNRQQIALIKQTVNIPVIANGDIHDSESLNKTLEETGCDAVMIGRAGTGKPWLYQSLLTSSWPELSYKKQRSLFLTHIKQLAALENEHKAVLQSKTLARYYFKGLVDGEWLQTLYTANTLNDLERLS